MPLPFFSRFFLPILFLLINLAAASGPANIFCKCTCGNNSTLIPITSPPSCSECNRQFCLKQHLPICRDVGEDGIFTTCFQRDSAKDRAVVFIFIVATVGLLGYAGLKGWVGEAIKKWRDRTARERYEALPGA
ncbi:unnamed protein product [Tuber melanosporum]|uniref:(Perigord truffle) hypothetical protein n=1 Tax=Tuber melanosporum (strain Mel28) TaxID=656061 RepID=D5GIG3_TUBMM|nr:uncharacterized protein GSTUM_00008487001 [Tuber melanosporum]CAZ84306.1 unnamed protein product [Tuber melanosporum]